MNSAISGFFRPLATTTALLVAISSTAATPKSGAEEKIPTPDSPVLMAGDSMMRLLGTAMEKAFKKAGVQPAAAFSSLGSGLVRPTVFDWTAKTAELLAEHKPRTVFVCLGTNDRQPVEDAAGQVVIYGKPEWEAAYSQRVGAMMDQLIDGGVSRVVWMLLPPMKEPVSQAHADLVNAIVRREADVESRRDKVTVFDLGEVLCRRPGVYTQYLMSPQGQALSVRDPDGVHLTNEGGKIVAAAVLKRFWKK